MQMVIGRRVFGVIRLLMHQNEANKQYFLLSYEYITLEAELRTVGRKQPKLAKIDFQTAGCVKFSRILKKKLMRY